MDVSIQIENRGESVSVCVNEHNRLVFIWLDDVGVLHVSCGDGQFDTVQLHFEDGMLTRNAVNQSKTGHVWRELL